ncbi:MAG: type II toxin-antitoxin system HicB family antitoxin [bacterium]|nr:type II toxin-antitoxin system HicB family antitoxin [bacterium]
MDYRFTVVINQEKKWFVAHCVELGVVSQGKSLEEAQKNLKEAVELYLEDSPEVQKQLPQKNPLITTLDIQYA